MDVTPLKVNEMEIAKNLHMLLRYLVLNVQSDRNPASSLGVQKQFVIYILPDIQTDKRKAQNQQRK